MSLRRNSGYARAAIRFRGTHLATIQPSWGFARMATSGRLDGCAACAEANSVKLPHKGELYEPSHAGRLIHADIAGPFARTQHGDCQYRTVLVNDHSRYKAAYPMRAKFEAPIYLRRFIAFFLPRFSTMEPMLSRNASSNERSI
eukprot:6179563-Pleurochrysis_carterae.AAC.2